MVCRLSVDAGKCTGCNRCVLWCSLARAGAINPGKARIRVLRREPSLDVPTVCLQCGACLDSCPIGLISRDPKTGAMVIDEESCTGCGQCLATCPYGLIFMDPERQVAIKCDLCGGTPECVRHCRFGAIRYEEAESVAERRREAFARMVGTPDAPGSKS